MDETTKENLIEILDALVARALCNNPNLDHLNMLYDSMISYDPVTGQSDNTHAKKLVKEEKRLAELGEQYFAEGYRVKHTERFTRFTPYDHRIPDDALIFRRIPAGYVATNEQERIEYLIKT